MKNYITHIHYAKYLTFEEKLAYYGLGIAKLFYFLAVKCRLLAFKKGFKKTEKVNAYVISIGNITTGGTGKTPVCVAIANYFSQQNKKTAILSRGYGGKLSNTHVNTISDGDNIFFSAHMSGDEPYWLAYNAQKTAVLTCKNRIEAAKSAINDRRAEVLILDDFGGETPSSFIRDEVLLPILQERMIYKRPTFMSSNLNTEQLLEHLAEGKTGVDMTRASRVWERIKALMDFVELNDNNYR